MFLIFLIRVIRFQISIVYFNHYLKENGYSVQYKYLVVKKFKCLELKKSKHIFQFYCKSSFIKISYVCIPSELYVSSATEER